MKEKIVEKLLYCGWFSREERKGIVEISESTFMLRHFGKYGSGLRFLFENEEWDIADIDSEDVGVVPDGGISALFGDFFKAKKGQFYFKVAGKGKHMLFRQSWSGSFRGLSMPKEEALYYNRRSSRGGRTGYTWAVYPRNWNALDKIREEKVEFHNVEVRLDELKKEYVTLTPPKFFFQVNYQHCIGVKIHVDDYRGNKEGVAHIVCRTKGHYVRIEIRDEGSPESPKYLLSGTSLYSNIKNPNASVYVEKDESIWKVKSVGGDTILRQIIIFVLEKGKKFSCKGERMKKEYYL